VATALMATAKPPPPPFPPILLRLLKRDWLKASTAILPLSPTFMRGPPVGGTFWFQIFSKQEKKLVTKLLSLELIAGFGGCKGLDTCSGFGELNSITIDTNHKESNS
jgi:hypothetical protein